MEKNFYSHFHNAQENRHRGVYQNGCGCPKCGELRKKGNTGGLGYYTEELFKEKPEIAKLPGLLYFVRVIGEREKFLKIGITKNSAKRRFGIQRGYKNVEIS